MKNSAIFFTILVSSLLNYDCVGENFHKIYFDSVYLEMGSNLGDHVKSRILAHLSSVGVNVYVLHEVNISFIQSLEISNNLILSLGNSSLSLILIPYSNILQMPYESFRMISKILSNHTLVLAANGRSLDHDTHKNITFNKDTIQYGAVVGAYAALEHLGFAFLHPLQAYSPSAIGMEFKEFDILEAPYWPARIFHIHTQHPLEVTEVLQGMDIPMFGPHGPDCEKGHDHADPGQEKGSYCERWEDMVDDVNRYILISNILISFMWYYCLRFPYT